MGEPYDVEVVVLDELKDSITFGARFDVFADAYKSVTHGCGALIDVVIALGNVADDVVREMAFFQYVGVGPVVGDWVVGHDNIGRYLTVEAGSAFYHGPRTNGAALVADDVGGEYYIIGDEDIAGEFDAVAEHAPVSDFAVMADMCLSHDEVVASYFGETVLMDGTVDDYVFVNFVVVADAEERLFAVPAKILRVSAYYGTLENFVVLANDCVMEHGGVRPNLAVIADYGVMVDECEGIYLDIIAEFGRRVYESEGVDYVGHILFVRSFVRVVERVLE